MLGQGIGAAASLPVGYAIAYAVGEDVQDMNSPEAIRDARHARAAELGTNDERFPIVEEAPPLTLPQMAQGAPQSDAPKNDGYSHHPFTGAPLHAPASAQGGKRQEGGEPASLQRVILTRAWQRLMGPDPDLDGIAAEAIDTGGGMVLWGVAASPNSVGVMPALDDLTDPREWMEAADGFDLPGDLAFAVERLARTHAAMLDSDGEASVRRRFLQRLGTMFREAGVEAIALRRPDGGFNWLAVTPEDIAREADGEPWTPPGGAQQLDELWFLGHALGLGGLVWLLPPEPEPAPPLATGAAGQEDDAAREAA